MQIDFRKVYEKEKMPKNPQGFLFNVVNVLKVVSVVGAYKEKTE